MNLRLIIDATSSPVEVIDTVQLNRYRGARADKTFVRFAFYSSGRDMRDFLSYDPSQQGLLSPLRSSIWSRVLGSVE